MMETSNDIANGEKVSAPQQAVLDVGKSLREAREALGLNVHDVAERIKFAPKQVEALEANDFVHLPQATFLRGFVRSYARMLQLDETILIAALPNESPKQLATKAQSVNEPFPKVDLLRRINVVWLAGALGVALVLALFVLLHEDDVTNKTTEAVVEPLVLPSADATASAVSEAPVVEGQITTPEIDKIPEPSKVSEPEPKKITEPQKTTELKKTTERETKKVVEPVKSEKIIIKPVPKIVVAPAPAEAENSVVPIEQLKRRPLHLVFLANTWAEVIDARGGVLLSRNNSKGSEKWVGGPGRAPYDISIGRPSNVKLYYKGKEIDLSAYAGMDVARLKVE